MAAKAALVLGVVTLVGGCCGDLAQREDILRRRQYEIDQRETRLRAAETKFKECVGTRYAGEDPGLEPPAGGGEGTGGEVDTSSGGTLSAEELEEIQRVERAGQPAVIACYTEELERRGNKDLQGKVVVKILVGIGGSADQVVIGQSTLKAPRVHTCVVQVIRSWEFPRLKAPAWYSTTLSFSPAY